MLPVRGVDRRIGRLSVLEIAVVAMAHPAAAHPVPFSYLDVRLQPHEVEIAIVAHIFDVSHDLNVDPPERLLEGLRDGAGRDGSRSSPGSRRGGKRS